MKVLQVFNLPMHHLLPLARSLAEIVGPQNFRYGAVYYPGMRERHEKLGWNCDERDPWILRLEDPKQKAEFSEWWDESDVVLCGERLFDLMDRRLQAKKLTFHMSERWWKAPIGRARLLHPRFALMSAKFSRLSFSPDFHFQAIGGYAAADISRITSFRGRVWNWGYFTELPTPLTTVERDPRSFKVLWAGRMLDWKRVDTLVRAFAILLTERPDASLILVGWGPEEERLKRLASALLPAGSFEFRAPMPAAEIPKLMRTCHAYVLPSNGGEGWGAVVNEAMAEGCLTIGCRQAGAPKTLIRDGENGMLFEVGDWRRLGALLLKVARDEALRRRLAQKGQETIASTWSPRIAASRFLAVTESILTRHPIPVFEDGPMSRPMD